MSGNMPQDEWVGGWLWRYESEPFESRFAIGISFLGFDYRTPGLVLLLNLGRTDGKVRQDNPCQLRSIKHTSFQRHQTAEAMAHDHRPRCEAGIGANRHDFLRVGFAGIPLAVPTAAHAAQ